jgi:hypothetical protein
VNRVALPGGLPGFALGAALLIAAIALLATATLVAAALSSTAISADDAASARAADVADAGVADALERLRWGWLRLDPSSWPAAIALTEFGGGSYSVALEALSGDDLRPRLDPSSPVSAGDPGVIACRVDSTGVWGQTRRVVHVVVLSTPDGLPRGLVVGDDATVAAPTILRGCGLYAGGDVSGREWVTPEAPVASQPVAAPPPVPDLAYGGLYAQAGVHAGGHIFARGLEEHSAGGAPAADSDADSGDPPPAALVAPPGPAVVGGLAAHASDPTAALGPSGLDLRLLERSGPAVLGAPALPVDGRIYVVDAGVAALALYGDRPFVPQACPATVVVLGDCVACGGPEGGALPTLGGALIVTGTLTVEAPLCVEGSLYARRLIVHAPLTVSFSAASGSAAAPGSANVRAASWRE